MAAGRYGGPVRVVLANDGSYDATERAGRTRPIARFRYARGEVLTAPNGGQAVGAEPGASG